MAWCCMSAKKLDGEGEASSQRSQHEVVGGVCPNI